VLFKLANGDEEEGTKRPLTLKEVGAMKAFFKANPSPSDDEVHEFAESLGVHPSSVEEEAYKMVGKVAADVGKHTHVPDTKYDARQLAAGIKVEMEHTDDPAKAKEIAKDHLEEGSDYYTRLAEMEEDMEEDYERMKQAAFFDELEKIAKDREERSGGAEALRRALIGASIGGAALGGLSIAANLAEGASLSDTALRSLGGAGIGAAGGAGIGALTVPLGKLNTKATERHEKNLPDEPGWMARHPRATMALGIGLAGPAGAAFGARAAAEHKHYKKKGKL